MNLQGRVLASRAAAPEADTPAAAEMEAALGKRFSMPTASDFFASPMASQGETRDASPPSKGAASELYSIGAETPMPGREREYRDFKAQGGSTAGPGGARGPAYDPPPIDEDRRSKSPGMQRNFEAGSTADFKRPYGM